MGSRGIARRWIRSRRLRSRPDPVDELFQVEAELLLVGEGHDFELALALALPHAGLLVGLFSSGRQPRGGNFPEATAFPFCVVFDVQRSKLRIDRLRKHSRLRLW